MKPNPSHLAGTTWSKLERFGATVHKVCSRCERFYKVNHWCNCSVQLFWLCLMLSVLVAFTENSRSHSSWKRASSGIVDVGELKCTRLTCWQELKSKKKIKLNLTKSRQKCLKLHPGERKAGIDTNYNKKIKENFTTNNMNKNKYQ